MYTAGRGVPKNYREAVKWFRKAAGPGVPGAAYALGVMYENGQGVPKNYSEAVEWYLKAAQYEHIPSVLAMHKLGVMHEKGLGVPRNYVLAYMWFRIAEENGSKKAVNNLNNLKKRMTSAQVAKAREMVARRTQSKR